jgi:hypothetical protein
MNQARLIKTQGNVDVYFEDDLGAGKVKRFIVSAELFNAIGFDWDKIQVLSDPEFDAIPRGPDCTLDLIIPNFPSPVLSYSLNNTTAADGDPNASLVWQGQGTPNWADGRKTGQKAAKLAVGEHGSPGYLKLDSASASVLPKGGQAWSYSFWTKVEITANLQIDFFTYGEDGLSNSVGLIVRNGFFGVMIGHGDNAGTGGSFEGSTEWRQLVVTFTGNTNDGKVTLYLDGKEVGSAIKKDWDIKNGQLLFGFICQTETLLADWRAYNVALTAAQVETQYSTQR